MKTAIKLSVVLFLIFLVLVAGHYFRNGRFSDYDFAGALIFLIVGGAIGFIYKRKKA